MKARGRSEIASPQEAQNCAPGGLAWPFEHDPLKPAPPLPSSLAVRANNTRPACQMPDFQDVCSPLPVMTNQSPCAVSRHAIPPGTPQHSKRGLPFALVP